MHIRAETLFLTLASTLPKVDALITTGGVSLGELDLLKPTIQHSLKGTIHFGRVAMKPGKPTTFATVPSATASSAPASDTKNKLIFALPGNPASALVTYHLFVLPALRQFAGHSDGRNHLPKVQVTLAQDVRLNPRPEYVRAVVRWDGEKGGMIAETTGGQRSSRVGSMLSANALLCMPALVSEEPGNKSTGTVPMGNKVDALLMGHVVGMTV